MAPDFHLAKTMFSASPPRHTNAYFGSPEGIIRTGLLWESQKGYWRAETSGVRDSLVALRRGNLGRMGTMGGSLAPTA